MARFEWDDRLSVGNEGLDSQHKELLSIYNKLHESLMNDTPEETVKTKFNTLEHLKNYTVDHFSFEESFLADINFPGLADHHRHHQVFTDKVLALQQDIDQNRVILSTSLIKLLRNWIVDHIAHEDKKYADYYRQTHSRQDRPGGH